MLDLVPSFLARFSNNFDSFLEKGFQFLSSFLHLLLKTPHFFYYYYYFSCCASEQNRERRRWEREWRQAQGFCFVVGFLYWVEEIGDVALIKWELALLISVCLHLLATVDCGVDKHSSKYWDVCQCLSFLIGSLFYVGTN